MKYITAIFSEKGKRKQINQDAVLLLKSKGIIEEVLAVVCDGMGGLEQSELASREVIKAFSYWFHFVYPKLEGEQEDFEDLLYEAWETLLQKTHQTIYMYGREKHIQLGTTITAMLFKDKKYYIAHVGDSRSYQVKKSVQRLTQDQTLADFERTDSARSAHVLIQGLGASNVIKPVYLSGGVEEGAVYLLCSDGLGNKIKDEEFLDYLDEEEKWDEKALEKAGRELIKEARRRGERDDISIILLRND